MVIDFEGHAKEIDFTFGPGTGAYAGCSVNFLGEFWVFGGETPNKRQVIFIL